MIKYEEIGFGNGSYKYAPLSRKEVQWLYFKDVKPEDLSVDKYHWHDFVKDFEDDVDYGNADFDDLYDYYVLQLLKDREHYTTLAPVKEICCVD